MCGVNCEMWDVMCEMLQPSRKDSSQPGEDSSPQVPGPRALTLRISHNRRRPHTSHLTPQPVRYLVRFRGQASLELVKLVVLFKECDQSGEELFFRRVKELTKPVWN